MNNLKVILLFALAFVYPTITPASTYVVNKDGTGDFTSIQAAIDQAAADETGGTVMGFAYFTKGQDTAYIDRGIENLVVGMLISVDDANWYEIVEIVDTTTVRIGHAFSENNRFNNYKVVTPAVVRITTGIYEESLDLQFVHFIRFQGETFGTNSRERVILHAPLTVNVWGVTSEPVFFNVQDYGALSLENLTARNTAVGPIIVTSSEAAVFDLPAPKDMNLTLKNVHLDSECCDVVFSSYGHVYIENARLEGENDVLGGYFKSLTMVRSDIMSLRTTTFVNAGKAVFVKLRDDSLIDNSVIITKARDPQGGTNGNGDAVGLYGTNGNTLTIRDSSLIMDGKSGGVALNLTKGGTASPPSLVSLENSKLIARSDGGVVGTSDIVLRTEDTVTSYCTEFSTVSGGGSLVVIPCP